MKRPYEIMVLFRILPEDETRAAIDQVTAYLEGNENEFGKIKKLDRNIIGRRKLAYEIDGQRDGLYILIHADLEPNHIPELELNLRLYDPVLRYIVIRDEEAERKEREAANAAAKAAQAAREQNAAETPETAQE